MIRLVVAFRIANDAGASFAVAKRDNPTNSRGIDEHSFK